MGRRKIIKQEKKQTINIVTFHNDMNKVALVGFNKREMDIFFAIAKKVRNTHGDHVTLTFSELREILEGKGKVYANDEAFLNVLMSAIDKLSGIRIKIDENGDYWNFTLYATAHIYTEEKKMDVQVSAGYLYFFEQLYSDFTRISLSEMYSLRTKYSQRLYTLLQQYKAVGKATIPIVDFRKILDIPESYQIKDIGKKVLNPSVEELKQYFDRLEVEKLKTGRTITAYRFTFTPEKETIDTEAQPVREESAPVTAAPPPRPEIVLCPRCGQEMILRESKTPGQYFWGHRYYDESCKAFYSTREEMEKDRRNLAAHKKEKEEMKKAQKAAWERVVRERNRLLEGDPDGKV